MSGKGKVIPVEVVEGEIEITGGTVDANIINQPIDVNANVVIPDPQNVNIAAQSITVDTNANVTNFPATQDVNITGQPIDVNANIQNVASGKPFWSQNPNTFKRIFAEIQGAPAATQSFLAPTLVAGFFLARPNTEEQVYISSSSTDDSVGGAGAITIYVEGINGSGDIISEVITADGTNDVLTANQYIRINLLQVLTAFNNNRNVGTITASLNPGAAGVITTNTLLNFIPVNQSQSKCARFSTGTKGAYFWRAQVTAQRNNATGDVTFEFYSRHPYNDDPDLLNVITLLDRKFKVQGPQELIYEGLYVRPWTDVFVIVLPDGNQGDASLNAIFLLEE